MKYEYMLQTWGGFYNEEYQKMHGYKPGYFWFDTTEERDAYVQELKTAEQKYSDCLFAAIATYAAEGEYTRLLTIAKMVFVYHGNEYPYEYNFGFGYSPEGAEFMFTLGNYSCDCNRSLFIGETNADFHELDCGNEIEMINFEVVQV